MKPLTSRWSSLGVFSVTLDVLLAIAMVINILVINSVKFFFEFLVWLTPIPLLDAAFEVCNKSLCAMLMAVYAFNPAIATLLNLAILVAAALLLRWISRRVRFYRTMILDPIITRLWTAFGEPSKPELIVFPKEDVGSICGEEPVAADSIRATRAAGTCRKPPGGCPPNNMYWSRTNSPWLGEAG